MGGHIPFEPLPPAAPVAKLRLDVYMVIIRLVSTVTPPFFIYFQAL